MKIEEFSHKWSGVVPQDASYQRVDASNILDAYMGKNSDKHKEFLITSSIESPKISSSQSIDVQRYLRDDHSWTEVKCLRPGKSTTGISSLTDLSAFKQEV